MKALAVLTIMLTAGLIQAPPSEGEDLIDFKIRETLGQLPSETNDWSWLTDEVRPVVIEKLLHQLATKEGIDQENAETKLVRIDHIETLQRLVSEMKPPVMKIRSLEEANGIAIQFIMPMVYNGSTTTPPEPPIAPGKFEPTIYVPARRTAIGLVLKIIFRQKEFPSETIAWARKMHGSIDYANERWVELLTSWWEHNQTAVMEKRYADATWLPRYKGSPITIDAEAARRFELQVAKHRDARHSAAVETILKLEQQHSSSKATWITFAAIVAAVAAFLRWKFAVKAR